MPADSPPLWTPTAISVSFDPSYLALSLSVWVDDHWPVLEFDHLVCHPCFWPRYTLTELCPLANGENFKSKLIYHKYMEDNPINSRPCGCIVWSWEVHETKNTRDRSGCNSDPLGNASSSPNYLVSFGGGSRRKEEGTTWTPFRLLTSASPLWSGPPRPGAVWP